MRRTLAAAALAVCVAMVAQSILAALTGLFQKDLGPSTSQLTWISDAFLVPISLFELTFGVLGDLYGRKRLLVGGALMLAVGELVVFLTPGAASSTGTRVLVLWIGQILAGIGAGALLPTSLAMMTASTHTARARARAITIWAAAFSVGALIGPLFGGILASIHFGSDPNAGWRWAALSVLFLALISATLSVAAQDSAAPVGRSLDLPGQITIAIALFALLFAVIQAPTSGWGSGQVIAGFVVAAVCLAAFVTAERRSAAPLLQLDFFKNRTFAAVAVITVVGTASFIGTVYSISVRLSSVEGYSPLKTSVAFILFGIMTLLLVPFTARLLERYNPRWVLSCGFALFGAGDLWISLTSSAHVSLGALAAPVVLAGIGFALALSSFTAVAVNAMPNYLAGMASGASNMLRDMGATLGPAIIGAVSLGRAATKINHALATNAPLRQAMAAFTASPAHAPAAQRGALAGAVHGVESGPLGANGVPATVTLPNGHTMPFNPLHDIAHQALGSALATGFLICGIAALVAALVAVTLIGGSVHDSQVDPRSLTD